MKKSTRIDLSLLVCLAFAFSLGLQHSDAKSAPFVDYGMVVGARALVRATVLSNVSAADEANKRVFTYTRLRVEKVFKGQISDDEIVLKEEGGEAGRLGERVSGTPTFAIGEDVIVYLDTWADGSLRVYQMFLGKLIVKRDSETGRESVVGDLSDADEAMLTPAGRDAIQSRASVVDAAEYCAALSRSVAAIERRSRRFAARYYRDAPLLERPPEYDEVLESGAVSPQSAILPVPSRWFEPDANLPVVFRINPDGAPTPGAVDDAAAAIQIWGTAPVTSLQVVRGEGITCGNIDGLASIVFNNCDGRFQAEEGCSRIIARGGLVWNRDVTTLVNGQVFRKALRGFVSLNPFSACSYGSDCDLREVITHELGHALGLGHSQYADSTMFGVIHQDGRCASIKSDDARSIAFVYPLQDPGPKPLAITTVRVESAIEGEHYLQVIEAQGGVLPYTWQVSLSGGRLPLGMGFDPSGVLYGPALVTGAFPIIVEVTDATGAVVQRGFTVTVVPRSSQFDSQFIAQIVPSAVQSGQQFTAVLRWLNTGTRVWDPAAGFSVAYILPPNNAAWGLDRVSPSGPVQPGAQLEVRLTATAPATAGAYEFQWLLQQGGFGVFGERSGNASIFVYPSLPPTIDAPSTLQAFVGEPFSFQFTASAGAPPFNWSVSSGSLPSGLALDSASGVLSGAPSSIGSTNVTIRVTDARSRITEKAITVNVTPVQLAIVNSLLPGGTVGLGYSAQLIATGGRQPYSWTLTQNTLPPGLSLTGSSGLISGTPASTGDFTFNIRVTDAESHTSNKALSISVGVAPLRIAAAAPAQAIRGTEFSLQMTASGGAPPYAWSVASGALPGGINLNAATGLVSGAPAVSGPFLAVVAVRDQNAQQATTELQLTVSEPANAPAIRSVKYKSAKRKLIVVADRLEPQAVLVVDGVTVSANFFADRLIAKPIELASGTHEIRIVNPGGVSSPPFALTAP
jgi:hypothetical protein